jgi:mRNA-degrading endonuclease RelE of RelBE toxin-antitoxin system
MENQNWAKRYCYIIYEIYDNILLVIVVDVGHRDNVYRRKK